jgi:uncharacterized protein (DUF2267 family)
MANINKYTEEANRFFKDVARELGNANDIPHAMRVTTSVLHTLRERISLEESFHVISQLPMIIKGIYVDGWDISRQVNRIDTLQEFLDELRDHSAKDPARDFGNDAQAAECVKAVVHVMRNYVSEGEMIHIKDQLPKEIAELFT